MTTIAVLTTIDDLEQARAIATALVERKLAACVQISAIRELHTYDLPAIYAFGMEHVFEPYAGWIAENSVPGVR